MILVLCLVAVAAAAGLTAALFWILRTPPTPSGPVFDFCEVCGVPATHELGGSFQMEPDGGSAMVACYCRTHAPGEAVKVR